MTMMMRMKTKRTTRKIYLTFMTLQMSPRLRLLSSLLFLLKRRIALPLHMYQYTQLNRLLLQHLICLLLFLALLILPLPFQALCSPRKVVALSPPYRLQPLLRRKLFPFRKV